MDHKYLPPRQAQASDHNSELNLFCPLPPPFPTVQRPQMSKLPASAEWPPSVPPAGVWPSVLRAGRGPVEGRQQGALASAPVPFGGLCLASVLPAFFAQYTHLCFSPSFVRTSHVPPTCPAHLACPSCLCPCDLSLSCFTRSLSPSPSPLVSGLPSPSLLFQKASCISFSCFLPCRS